MGEVWQVNKSTKIRGMQLVVVATQKSHICIECCKNSLNTKNQTTFCSCWSLWGGLRGQACISILLQGHCWNSHPWLHANPRGGAGKTQQLHGRNANCDQAEEEEPHSPSSYSVKGQMAQAENKGVKLVPFEHPIIWLYLIYDMQKILSNTGMLLF